MIQDYCFERDGFYFRDEICEILVIQGERLDESVRYIKSKDIRSLELNDIFYKTGQISFVNDTMSLESIRLVGFDHLRDYSFLNSQVRSLRKLHGINLNKAIIDINDFKNLEDLAFEGDERIVNQIKHNRKLKSISFVSKNFADIEKLARNNPQLESLGISSNKLTDLKGIQILSSLREVGFDFCKALTTTVGLDRLSYLEEVEIYHCKAIKEWSFPSGEALKKVRIEKCPGLESLEVFKGCKGLEELHFSDCKEIESLKPIFGLRNLHTLVFRGDTRIKDKNLAIISKLKIKNAYFRNRRGYSI